MNSIKISELWTAGKETIKNSIFYNLLQQISIRSIEFTSPAKADLLIIGPYNLQKISRRFKNFFLRNLNSENISHLIDRYDKGLLFSKNKPLILFYCHENIRLHEIKSDFSISYDFGDCNNNHLRFPIWKENIDWKSEGIIRPKNFIINRYGEFYDLEKLKYPLGKFNNNKKKICLFTSHMNEPRNQFYSKLKKYFEIDGFGPYFNKEIPNHNESGFFKKDILKNYQFNLCPHNALHPGYYEEKIPEAFLSGCLPISWSDENVKEDFNPKAFINLNEKFFTNFEELIEILKDDTYLKNFLNEPLLKNNINLKKERQFVERILKKIS